MDAPNEPLRVVAADEAGVLAALPPSARALAAYIGLLPTIEVLRKVGGERLFLPRWVPDDRHPLVAVVGFAAARALVHLRGGEGFDVPSIEPVERYLRDLAICADADAGASAESLRQRYGLTRRRIRSIVAASGASPGTPTCVQPPRVEAEGNVLSL